MGKVARRVRLPLHSSDDAPWEKPLGITRRMAERHLARRRRSTHVDYRYLRTRATALRRLDPLRRVALLPRNGPLPESVTHPVTGPAGRRGGDCRDDAPSTHLATVGAARTRPSRHPSTMQARPLAEPLCTSHTPHAYQRLLEGGGWSSFASATPGSPPASITLYNVRRPRTDLGVCLCWLATSDLRRSQPSSPLAREVPDIACRTGVRVTISGRFSCRKPRYLDASTHGARGQQRLARTVRRVKTGAEWLKGIGR